VFCLVLEIPPHFGAEIQEAARNGRLQLTTFVRRTNATASLRS
jgi:hypothetical protein